jgi:Ca2+-binding EF-hand superfamily protein
MAESKRMQDAMKEQKLRERLAAERQSQLEKNLLKADEAQAKVERAAQQRIAMTAQQRADYAVRMEAQQRRVEEQQAERERKMAEIKAHGEQKQAEIVRAIEQQKALQEARKQAIMQQEAKKNAELDAKAERERQLRAEAMRERQLQEAASRGRVERTMGELQSQLESLEGQLEARAAKVDDFCNNRHGHMELAQKLAVAGALERAMMSNSMAKMRQNLSSEGMASLRLEIPTERREVHNPELKALLQRLDPAGAGEVPLAQMKKTLTKLLPPTDEFGGQRPKRIGSQSMPSLSASLDALQLSRYERAVAAFKKIDADNSGTISKRELYEVLKTAGLSNGKQALEVFKGADADNDGQLNFEEFEKIAKAIC